MKIIKCTSALASAGSVERWMLFDSYTSGFSEELCPVCKIGGYDPDLPCRAFS